MTGIGWNKKEFHYSSSSRFSRISGIGGRDHSGRAKIIMNSHKSRKVLRELNISLSLSLFHRLRASPFTISGHRVPICQPAAKNVSRTGNFSGAFENLAESGIRHDRLVFCTSSFPAPSPSQPRFSRFSPRANHPRRQNHTGQ